MKKELGKLKKDFEKGLKQVSDFLGLDELEQEFFGRKSGILSDIMKSLKGLEKDARKEFGQMANDVKHELLVLLGEKKEVLEKEKMSKIAKEESIDVTQPYLPKKETGHIHPMTLGTWEIEKVFKDMGFIVEDGPELESDYYNFQAVNIEEHHPARDGHDTFYIKDNPTWVMRTQTSNMQVRSMQKYSDGGTKPLRFACPGRVYRNEALDATHEHTFYQFEGLIAGKDINIGHLIATLKELLQGLFKKDNIEVRLRPSYFPFVEPGFELDMLIDLGKGKQWVEMLGCGLMHPNVVKEGGYDPEEWQAFAFGMGINRLVMAKYGIEDVRYFQSGDLRFSSQF
ncbi:MAG: phenylalanine--tRNA ligase subunit alpha [Candidatus Magasanikbacteria bacterium]|jgi:phenylalanyl-tRNA synthetase alpha chain|nr:phenylalanine--tRNA ligase subunit alpha [Candidatus Magasanikbacteria bacterium]MBT4221502.1 phenylalanine--tRNA ligase subunit alpha [Candidatus Magasanikbacteria bacterium]MBT4350453.1 phenylalanine--tRNA ligase subunit alpha [Candidatus Magasanikbacteria bacterium]MBT4541840.1 phenylalanine--tRNA ligase subunit alpha [Candidatus Magasanikbacteria bacterium]MBT6253369.1 phenylalanine--tRNA ligase subunit alpha [Candidatus Magasanikbacteria bacterium]